MDGRLVDLRPGSRCASMRTLPSSANAMLRTGPPHGVAKIFGDANLVFSGFRLDADYATQEEARRAAASLCIVVEVLDDPVDDPRGRGRSLRYAGCEGLFEHRPGRRRPTGGGRRGASLYARRGWRWREQGPAPSARRLSTRFFAALAVLLGHFDPFLGLPTWLSRWIAGGYGVSFFFGALGIHPLLPLRGRFRAGRGAERLPPLFRGEDRARLSLLRDGARPHHGVVLPHERGAPGHHRAAAERGVLLRPANLFPALQTFASTYANRRSPHGSGWSISTEFGFYLACPLILALIARHFRTRGGLAALLGLTVAFGVAAQALALVLVFRYGWSREFWLDLVASRNIFWRLPEFLTGVVAARLLYGGHLGWLGNVSARNVLLVAGLVLVSALNVAPGPRTAPRSWSCDSSGWTWPTCSLFAAIVLALAAGPTWASPLLKLAFPVFLGDISYAVYIYHWTPWTVVAHAKAAGWPVPSGLVAGVIVLTILFSAASYLWYEKPLRLYLRRKFAGRRHRWPRNGGPPRADTAVTKGELAMIRWYRAALAVLMSVGAIAAYGQACVTTLSPGADLTAAVAGATAGDMICLNVGTYFPPSSGFPNNQTFAIGNAVIVRGLGTDPSQVVLQAGGGGDYAVYFTNYLNNGKVASGATLTNLKIQGSNGDQGADNASTVCRPGG